MSRRSCWASIPKQTTGPLAQRLVRDSCPLGVLTVAAGAVVSKDVPDVALVGSVSARVIRSTPDMVERWGTAAEGAPTLGPGWKDLAATPEGRSQLRGSLLGGGAT